MKYSHATLNRPLGVSRGYLTALMAIFTLLVSANVSAKSLEVVILGVEGELLANIQLLLSLNTHRGNEVVAKSSATEADGSTISEFEVQRLHRRASTEITSALKPFGFYRVQLEASLTQEEKRWLATYVIDVGPPTRLGDVTVDFVGDAKNTPELREVLSNNTVRSGDVLVHSQFEAMKAAMFDVAYQTGYLNAEWLASDVRVAPDRELASLKLVLNTGPRFYFGDVVFEQDVLNPSLLQRFVPFRAGDPYDIRQLLSLQFALDDSQYFQRVEIDHQKELAGSDHRIPITVRTTPQAPQQYTTSIGVATDTGPRVSGGAIFRRINRAGHRVRADLRLSTIESAIAVRYEVPIADVATDTLAFSANAKQEKIGDAETDQFGLRVSRNDTWRGFRQRLYVNVGRENFQFDGDPQRQSDLLYPGVNLLRERADDPRYPRRGYSVALDLRGATEALFSDSTFLRFDLEARWVKAIAENTRILVHAEIGAIETSAFDRLPPSQRFFTGGDRSVRGYGYQAIGTRNTNDVVVGGEYLALGSLELDHFFYKDYGAALFVDTGDAFSDTPDFRIGAGIGFRWRSPIGMVRLDLAHPFDNPDENFRIHISIGPDL